MGSCQYLLSPIDFVLKWFCADEGSGILGASKILPSQPDSDSKGTNYAFN